MLRFLRTEILYDFLEKLWKMLQKMKQQCGSFHMITYNDIYEAARQERYSEQIQPLSKNFVVEISKYLKEKKQFTLKESEEFSGVIDKTKKQFENAVTFFKELIVRRRKKILNLVLIATETGISKKDFENMLDFEK